MKIYLLYHMHEITDDFGTHDEEKLYDLLEKYTLKLKLFGTVV